MHPIQTRILAQAPLSSRTFFRSICFTCRGEPIQYQQLFEYTNGRFLVNETSQKARRYANFDVDALCSLASFLPSVSSPISKIDKMEGGFNKVMLMTAENGKEIVAKMPFPRIVLMDAVPVSNVIAWSSDSSSPIGSEYILMEKAGGRQLKFGLIRNLARLEGQLAFSESPGYKKFVYATFRPSTFRRIHHRTNVTDLGLAFAGRGLAHIQNSTLVPRGPHFGSKDEHTRILDAAMGTIPKLAEHPIVKPFSRPTLWHGDRHLGNIYICDRDPMNIMSIIDWQFLSVMPAFMQAQWPSFLDPPENYETGIVKPELPPSFHEMDPDEQAFAVTERDQALLSKCYQEPPSVHKLEVSQYMDWHGLKLYTQELLHSDDDGWVPPQLDFDKVQERHAELCQLYLQGLTSELSEEEAETNWVYVDKG
ncbi:hypothetical protein BDV27DRAFT_149801 [Aspergillus caelatus]|uniref:Altered inheritance of mitochondria protein 9, mitochondrial n=1 Tax=Aspergillus caelatus TaxID=61420 RepID=A0A5N6ZNJ5_9EURO|nr:uncharacterized protein BDV27DRAFT_149801 [Aspergillus caelatus]KAE8359194.1 hypothetical protein BDV27DRAFT_149801 [Aspergillus caelatus]